MENDSKDVDLPRLLESLRAERARSERLRAALHHVAAVFENMDWDNKDEILVATIPDLELFVTEALAEDTPPPMCGVITEGGPCGVEALWAYDFEREIPLCDAHASELPELPG